MKTYMYGQNPLLDGSSGLFVIVSKGILENRRILDRKRREKTNMKSEAPTIPFDRRSE